MSLYEDYQDYRDQAYSGDDYRTDPYLGERLNQSELELIDRLLFNKPRQHFNPEATQIRSQVQPSDDGIGRLEFDDPLINAYAQVAYARTKAHFDSWRQGPVYPDDPTVLDRYSNVDPLGKYCAKDMEFAQRLAKLKDAAPMANPQRHPPLINAFEALNNPPERLMAVLNEAQKTFQTVREAQHAAKVCPNQMAAELLESHAKDLLENSESVRKLDQYYTALEHITGLRQGAPSAEVLATAAALGLPTNLVNQTAPHAHPQAMSMNFQNFDHMVQHGMFAHPSNWGSTPRDLAVEPNNPKLEDYVSRYAAATARTMLDVIYQGKEDAPPALSNNTRGTMVVVDGMTVEERMAEEYRRLRLDIPYNQWYTENVNQRTAEYVAAGVMAGKRVEAYVPQPDGKLSQQPIRIDATGYAPSAQKPVTLSAWQRFMNKFGFYKEKAAQAQEDRRSALARERIQPRYTAARVKATSLAPAKNTYEEMFFGDYLRERDIKDVIAFKNSLHADSPTAKMPGDRNSFVSLCMGMMASQGVPIEDIMDPTKRREEKQLVGRMLFENLAANGGRGNSEWLARMNFNAQQGLLREINRVMHGVSLKNNEQLRQVMPALNVAVSTLQDCFQDIDFIFNEPERRNFYNNLFGTPNQGGRDNLYDAFANKVSGTEIATRAIVDGFQARADMATCSDETFANALGNYVKGQAITSLIPDSPDIAFTERQLPSDQTMLLIGAFTNQSAGAAGKSVLYNLAQRITKDPNLRKTVNTMALTGGLDSIADIRVVPYNNEVRVLMTEPNLLINKKLPAAQKAAAQQTAAQQTAAQQPAVQRPAPQRRL